MYFWRVERLKTDLAVAPMTDRQVLPYFMAYLLLVELTVLLTPFTIVNQWDWVDSIASVSLVVLGALYAYQRNGGAGGQQFLPRYFAIGFVVGLRWLVGLVVVMAVVMIGQEVAGHGSEESTPVETVVLILAEAILYWRIGHHIGDVADRAGVATKAELAGA